MTNEEIEKLIMKEPPDIDNKAIKIVKENVMKLIRALKITMSELEDSEEDLTTRMFAMDKLVSIFCMFRTVCDVVRFAHLSGVTGLRAHMAKHSDVTETYISGTQHPIFFDKDDENDEKPQSQVNKELVERIMKEQGIDK